MAPVTPSISVLRVGACTIAVSSMLYGRVMVFPSPGDGTCRKVPLTGGKGAVVAAEAAEDEVGARSTPKGVFVMFYYQIWYYSWCHVHLLNACIL